MKSVFTFCCLLAISFTAFAGKGMITKANTSEDARAEGPSHTLVISELSEGDPEGADSFKGQEIPFVNGEGDFAHNEKSANQQCEFKIVELTKDKLEWAQKQFGEKHVMDFQLSQGQKNKYYATDVKVVPPSPGPPGGFKEKSSEQK